MICQVAGCEAHYGCRLRAKGVGIAPSATPTRFQHRPRPMNNRNSWERGIAGETRPDGSFMPYLDSERVPIGVHDMQHRRHGVEE